MPSKTAPRGRPPLKWEAASDLPFIKLGTPVAVDSAGAPAGVVHGRIRSLRDGVLTLTTTTRELVQIEQIHVKRFRLLDGLYEPGDPVVRRGVSAKRWRGGVVRTVGPDVLVEQIDGSFAWHPEGDLEPAEARDKPAPRLKPGPPPRVLA